MKFSLSLCLCAFFFNSFAQDKNQFYALDSNWNQTVLDSSKYLLWIHAKEDGNWQWDYYNTWGPLIKSQSFADHDGTVLNGASYIYNKAGDIDSTGIFDHGKRNGSFFKYKSHSQESIILVKQYDYLNDSMVKFIDFQKSITSIKDHDSTKEKESEYPGGVASWYSYLKSNLIYPERAVEKEIQGQVRVEFLVDEKGRIKDPFIAKSLEYSVDQASIELILKSGFWVPGMKDGQAVKTYKIQPINYKLENR
jgi:periplasmic protein TonB